MEITSDEYWDCNCDTGYIHPKTVTKCQKCGAIALEQPDSMICEVREHIKIWEESMELSGTDIAVIMGALRRASEDPKCTIRERARILFGELATAKKVIIIRA